MAKTQMSKGFAQFAKSTTKGSFDEARKAERQGRGIPFAIGDKGTGVLSIECGEGTHKEDSPQEGNFPKVSATITVLTPESGKGKELTDPLNLTWYIKDSDKEDSDWTAEDAWAAMLNDFNRLGLPEELTKQYEDFQEVLDYIDAEPRVVDWEITAGDMYRGQVSKRVEAYVHVDEKEAASADSSSPGEFPEGTKFCTLLGVRYGILSIEGEQAHIRNVNTGREKHVSVNRLEMEEA